MSIRLMTEIWDDEADLKASTLLLGLALADHANERGLCWPSVGLLARRARCTTRQAHRALNELVELGVILKPVGPRTDESPFVVGRQNVIRHESQADATSETNPGDADVASLCRSPQEGTTKEPSGARQPTVRQLEDETIGRVWTYWIEISGKTRMKLDAKRSGHIRNAIKLSFTEDEIKRALLGLTRSPHHRGENEQRKEYMDIHYALRGKGDESDDARIEKAMTWAAVHAPGQSLLSQAQVDRYLDDVRYTLSLSHRPERARAEDSYRKLVAAGFRLVQLDRAPWARLER